jgi:hypothetical protein
MTTGRPLVLLTCIMTMAGGANMWAAETPAASIDLSGRRVRIVAGSADRIRLQGRVLEVTAETLLVQPEGKRSAERIPLGIVSHLELYRGSHSATRWGAAIGALACGTTGYLVGRYGFEFNSEDADLLRAIYSIGGALAGSAVGAALGALVGSRIQIGEWETVPAARLRPTIAILPERRGVRVALALRF